MPKYCCVPGCNEPSGLKFPKDSILSTKWQIAVHRELPNKKLWKPTPYSFVCFKHFTENDFIQSDFERQRRDLKKGVVPSVFDFKKKSLDKDLVQSKERDQRALNCRLGQRSKQIDPDLKQISELKNSNTEPSIPDHEQINLSNQPVDLDIIETFVQVDFSGK